jgi:hypothetical protein
VVALLLDAVPDCLINRRRAMIRKMGVAQNQITPWLANRNCLPCLPFGFGCPRNDGVFVGSLFVFVRFSAMVSDEVAG